MFPSKACMARWWFPSPGGILGTVACLRWPGNSRQRRLHGPRQLEPICRRAPIQDALLWVVGLASLMAIFMQVIRLVWGPSPARILAQCCAIWLSLRGPLPNWLMSEVGDRGLRPGEVLVSAVALNLLFPHSAAMGGHHHCLDVLCSDVAAV